MKPTPRLLLLTFIGGALGTALRFGLSFVFDDTLMVLFIVNLLGAAALGWFNGHPHFATDERRALWAIGFAGGFTTMSGVALFMGNNIFFAFNEALLWVALMFALGLAVYWLALIVAKRAVAK